MSLQLGWQSLRIDAAALEDVRRIGGWPAYLEPDGAPVAGAFVHFVATGPSGDIVTQGSLARVLDDNSAIVDMVFVSDERVRDLYPVLLHIRRPSATKPWSIVHCERLFAEEIGDPIFEEVRAQAVGERAAHLASKVEKPMSPFEAMLRGGTEMETMRAELARVRDWHQKTGRTWSLTCRPNTARDG